MEGANFFLFLLAAVIIAAIPGPGIFYVAARTLSGGRRAGIASTFGTALGGLVHVIAGGLGVSAIILASAQLFTVLKLAGALYLIWLGIRTIREAGHLPTEQTGAIGFRRAFREGIVVEALAAGSNDLEAPATQIQPLIGEVIAALNATNGAWLARMSGSGATCFAIYENTAEAQRAAQKIQRDHPRWWVHAGTLG